MTATAKISAPSRVTLAAAGGVSVWPWAVVRATGFPASWVLELAAPEAAGAADQWLAARRAADAARRDLSSRLGELVPSCRDPAERRALRQMIKAVARGQVPEGAPVPTDAWRAARERLADARARYEHAFAAGRDHARGRLRELAREPRIQEAIAWQNHHALRLMRSKLDDLSDTKSVRAVEATLTRYLQRYCVKNDTIGFFGPVCWARVSGTGPAIVHQPGDELVASREAFFEDWAVVALCDVIDRDRDQDRDRGVHPWLRPRRLPVVGLVGQDAYLLMPAPMHLTAAEAQILALCDGQRTARAIAAQVLTDGDDGADGVAGEADVFATLESLCKRGLATWRVETVMSMRAIELLRAQLEAVDDAGIRARALAPLERLDQARRAAETASGPDALVHALDALDRTFADITGRAPSRSAGKPYAGRTLVFLDSRRSDRITLGPAILDRLAPVLSILVQSGRWYTCRIAHAYRAALADAYRQLAAQMSTPEVPALRLWMAVQNLFPLRSTQIPALFADILADMRQRWQQVLPPGPDHPDHENRVDHVRYASRDVLPRAREVFAADAPGWKLARHHGPDILIAAADAAAIERGDFDVVVGEFHCANNTSIQALFLAQHPELEDMYRLWQADFAEPCIIPCSQREQYIVRGNHELASERDYRLEWAPAIAGPPRAQKLLVGDLVVEAEGEALIVRTRDRALRFDILDFFGLPLSALSSRHYAMPSSGDRSPRISIDDVIIARRRWTIDPAALDFVTARSASERFARARAWIADAGVPRFCFVKSPLELKPIYIDFASPLFIDVLARLTRKAMENSPAHRLSLSEMLPGHEQLWLADGRGNRYTSEIRLVAVDAEHA